MTQPQKRQRPAATGRQGKANNSRAINNTTASAQRQRLLEHLRHDSIDTITARRELNVMHPAMRIKELREAGHKIVTIRIEQLDDQGRKHRKVARYVLQGGAA